MLFSAWYVYAMEIFLINSLERTVCVFIATEHLPLSITYFMVQEFENYEIVCICVSKRFIVVIWQISVISRTSDITFLWVSDSLIKQQLCVPTRQCDMGQLPAVVTDYCHNSFSPCQSRYSHLHICAIRFCQMSGTKLDCLTQLQLRMRFWNKYWTAYFNRHASFN